MMTTPVWRRTQADSTIGSGCCGVVATLMVNDPVVIRHSLRISLVGGVALWAWPHLVCAALTLTAVDAAGRPITSTVDGNSIRLRASLTDPVGESTTVRVRLEGDDAADFSCSVGRGGRGCETIGIRTLGWRHGSDGQARPDRVLRAALADGTAATLSLRIAPRPVVLVHGFLSDHSTWSAWTGPGGFLAQHGLAGFAVGDGQFDGRLDTGDISHPTATTKTLPANATALGRYVGAVRRATGAEMVDLVAHSMGGLVSRYYIAKRMQGRDVAQLVMLGSPHGGSECSALPVALGLFGPAALELRPAFLRHIFNRTVTRRGGVPFRMLAGDPIVESFKAPCTGVPSDSVVGIESVSAIPGVVDRMPVLHTDMTSAPVVFEAFVLPHLQRGPHQFRAEDDPLLFLETPAPAQFTRVFTGRVEPGGRAEVVVDLDQVAIASFALFDTARRPEVTVRGAGGQVITLTAKDHGLIRVDDPSSLLTLGYGFRNPRPGPWRITLESPPPQPGSVPVASEFSLSARVLGGAVLQARATPLAPPRGSPVSLSAGLEHPEASLTQVSIRAVIRRPDGKSESLELSGDGAEQSASWRPAMPGIHAIDVVASAIAGKMRVERTTFLAVDVR